MNNEMPKVSFVLPAYKRAYLHEAIASILAQTYTDFELIVVDDASPENLKEIIDEFHDERLVYHRNEENIGGKDLVAAWNHALEFAKGEFVICAGDDDVYMPEYLVEMIQLTLQYPNAHVFHCRIAYINEKSEVINIAYPRAEYENGILMIYHSCVKPCGQVIGDFMYRRLELLKIGGYVNAPRAWYSDVMTAIQMSINGGACCSPKILFKWRNSGINISTRYDDIEDKIEASLIFKKWIWNIIRSVVPSNPDDDLVLHEIEKGVDIQIYDCLKGYWVSAPYRLSLDVLEKSNLDSNIKRQWRRERIRARYGLIANYVRVKKFFVDLLNI